MLKNNLYPDIERNLVNRLIDGYANPTPPPIPLPPTPAVITEWGVNIAGMEFGEAEAYPGTWPIQPPAMCDHLIEKGFTTFRVPIKMERAQAALNGPLYEPYMTNLDTLLTYLTGQGKTVILDCHNYMERRQDITVLTNYQMGSAEFPTSSFYDFWTRLANRYKSNPLIRYDLMNEPKAAHPTPLIFTIFQGAVNAIRATGSTQILYIPTYGYSSALQAVKYRSDLILGKINDPLNKTKYTFHEYLNPATGGTTNPELVASDNIVSYRLATVTEQARAYGVKLFLGEIGIADSNINPKWADTIATVFDFMHKNDDVWETVTFWASGITWQNSYVYKLNPRTDNAETVRPQTAEIAARITRGKELIPQASLHWDKTGQTKGVANFAALFDFSRSTVGWDWNAGILQSFSIDAPRLTDRGIRFEPQRKNVYPSVPFKTMSGYTEGNAFLAAQGGAYVPKPSPNGGNNAATFTDLTTTATHTVLLGTAVTDTPNSIHCVSAYFKTYENYYVWLNGSDSGVGGAKHIVLPMQALTTTRKGDWARGVVRNVLANASIKIRVGNNGDSAVGVGANPPVAPATDTSPFSYLGRGESFDIFHPQAEPLALWASTPILGVTAGNPVTRAADIGDLKAAHLSQLAGNFTILIEFDDLPLFGVALPFLLINGVEALRINADHRVGGDFGGTLASSLPMELGNSSNANQTGSGWRNTPRKYAISCRRSAGRVVIGGQGIASAAQDVSIPAITSVRIGQSGGALCRFTVIPLFQDTTALQNLLLRDVVT